MHFIEKAMELGESIDYLTFVPDGEPTLDINLGLEIESLKHFGIKIAVLTNASLIWRPDVKQDLMKADLVSLKIDSTKEDVWQKINRPHRSLKLTSILDGMLEFARTYSGELITEMMLVEGINDDYDNVKEVVDFLTQLKPAKAYLSIPIRPPAEKWVRPPNEGIINRAYQIFKDKIDRVECLLGYEGNDFALSGNVEEDLLSIAAVHPMREEAVEEYLTKANRDWSVIQKFIMQGLIIEMEYEGKRFYMRRLS